MRRYLPGGAVQISKTEWYRVGGFKNSKCWRRAYRNGSWSYFINYY